jgi:hypothetical protein
MARTARSVLAADFGSVHTRAVLIDVVDGAYRLVARGSRRTTDDFPVYNIAVGFDRVLRQLTDATERRFMADAGQIITPEQPDRSGVDFFAITASIGRPLRAVVVGLTSEVSVASAMRAAEGTYIEIAAAINLEDGRSEEDRLNAIILSVPDIVLVVGGTEDGAQSVVLQLVEVVAVAVSLMERSRRPTIIFAGNSALGEKLKERFDNLTAIFIAQNVRPSLIDEQLDAARLQLGRAYDRYKETHSESFALIGAMSHTGVLPTAQSYNIIGDYLGKVSPGGALLVDMGSSSSTLAVSTGERTTTSIRTDLGLGRSAPLMLDVVGSDAVRRWLPFEVTENILQNYTLNKVLRPATIPASVHDVYIEHALLKTGIQAMIASAHPGWESGSAALGLIVGAGAALTNTGHPGYDAMLLLDSVQPAGVTRLQADPYGLIPAMGAIALHIPDAVVQLLDGNNLVALGTCFSASGRPRLDRPAMKVKITLPDGKVVKHTVLGGHLWVYPLPAGKTARVQVSCAGGMSINGKRGVKLSVTAGTAGLIFDARGRPIRLAADAEGRAAQLPMWVSEMTGDPPREIEPLSQDGVSDEVEVDGDHRGDRGGRQRQSGEGGRRGMFGRRKESSGDDRPDRAKTDRDGEQRDELSELRDVLS